MAFTTMIQRIAFGGLVVSSFILCSCKFQESVQALRDSFAPISQDEKTYSVKYINENNLFKGKQDPKSIVTDVGINDVLDFSNGKTVQWTIGLAADGFDKAGKENDAQKRAFFIGTAWSFAASSYAFIEKYERESGNRLDRTKAEARAIMQNTAQKYFQYNEDETIYAINYWVQRFSAEIEKPGKKGRAK